MNIPNEPGDDDVEESTEYEEQLDLAMQVSCHQGRASSNRGQPEIMIRPDMSKYDAAVRGIDFSNMMTKALET